MTTSIHTLRPTAKPKNQAPWFSAQAISQDVVEVTIEGLIGGDGDSRSSAREFINTIQSFGVLKEIRINLNSPGGDAYAGVRIYHFLKQHRAQVIIKVTRSACSIASIVLLAGDKREMAEGSSVMVHAPSVHLEGAYNGVQIKEALQQIGKIQDTIAGIYADSTRMSKAEWICERRCNTDPLTPR